MLTTLWVMSIASVVAMSAALVGRHAVSEGSARVELERARWEALACERRAQATIDGILRDAPTLADGTEAWRTLRPRVIASPLVAQCDVSLEAVGTRLDINIASEEMLTNFFAAIGMSDRALELAESLEDWRDDDEVARDLGAEWQWYASAGRIIPRDTTFADVTELQRVRGFENLQALDTLLTVEPGRISLATAPVPVLMSVPGITRETAERLVELQLANAPVADLLSVTGSISRASVAALAARYPDAVRATTPDPDAWLVRVRVIRGLPAVGVQLEWRMLRTGRKCAVAQTRSML
jgi:type II secretory pathway component PulK